MSRTSNASPSEANAEPVAQSPAWCSQGSPAAPRLTASKELNDVVRDIWAIEDETTNASRAANLAAAMVVGPGVFHNPAKNGDIDYRLFAGPALMLRVNFFATAGAVPHTAAARRGSI